MNDEAEVMEPEAEAPEVNPIESMVDNIFSKNFAGAQTTFNDLIGDRMTAALDAEKTTLCSAFESATPGGLWEVRREVSEEGILSIGFPTCFDHNFLKATNFSASRLS